MAGAKEFEPDVKVRTKKYKIGCIGAGMIMAECHLAAYKEAGFPVVAIASRTKANAEKVAKRWGIPKVHDTPETLIEDTEVEIIDLAFPPDQQPALIRHALKQKHIKAILAQKPLALSLKEAIKLRDAGRKGRQDPLRQPEHALRPVDARAEADHRQRRARRHRLCADRHARDPALADLPRGVRPADALQHERAPPRRAALPVRRSRRDHDAHPQGPAHEIRPLGRHHRLDDEVPVRASWRYRWRTCGPARARRATRTTSTSTGASMARTASPRARSAGRRARHPR